MTDEWINFYPKTKTGSKPPTKPVSFRFDPLFVERLERLQQIETERLGRPISSRAILQTAVTNHPRFRQMVKAEQEAHANNKETSSKGRSA